LPSPWCRAPTSQSSFWKRFPDPKPGSVSVIRQAK
jgi:hypothetical protein